MSAFECRATLIWSRPLSTKARPFNSYLSYQQTWTELVEKTQGLGKKADTQIVTRLSPPTSILLQERQNLKKGNEVDICGRREK